MLPLLLPLWLLGLNMLLLSQVGLQQQGMAPQPGQDGLLQLGVCLKARALQPDTCMSETQCQEVNTEHKADSPSYEQSGTMIASEHWIVAVCSRCC